MYKHKRPSLKMHETAVRVPISPARAKKLAMLQACMKHSNVLINFQFTGTPLLITQY